RHAVGFGRVRGGHERGSLADVVVPGTALVLVRIHEGRVVVLGHRAVVVGVHCRGFAGAGSAAAVDGMSGDRAGGFRLGGPTERVNSSLRLGKSAFTGEARGECHQARASAHPSLVGWINQASAFTVTCPSGSYPGGTGRYPRNRC